MPLPPRPSKNGHSAARAARAEPAAQAEPTAEQRRRDDLHRRWMASAGPLGERDRDLGRQLWELTGNYLYYLSSDEYQAEEAARAEQQRDEAAKAEQRQRAEAARVERRQRDDLYRSWVTSDDPAVRLDLGRQLWEQTRDPQYYRYSPEGQAEEAEAAARAAAQVATEARVSETQDMGSARNTTSKRGPRLDPSTIYSRFWVAVQTPPARRRRFGGPKGRPPGLCGTLYPTWVRLLTTDRDERLVLAVLAYWFSLGSGRRLRCRVQAYGHWWLARGRFDLAVEAGLADGPVGLADDRAGWARYKLALEKRAERVLDRLKKSGLVVARKMRFDGKTVLHLRLDWDLLATTYRERVGGRDEWLLTAAEIQRYGGLQGLTDLSLLGGTGPDRPRPAPAPRQEPEPRGDLEDDGENEASNGEYEERV